MVQSIISKPDIMSYEYDYPGKQCVYDDGDGAGQEDGAGNAADVPSTVISAVAAAVVAVIVTAAPLDGVERAASMDASAAYPNLIISIGCGALEAPDEICKMCQ